MRQGSDQRISQRTAFRQALAFELSVTRAGRPGEEPLRRQAVGIDLSAHGLGLETDCPLEKGELIKLLPGDNGNGVKLPPFARVQWVQADARGRCRVGLCFLGFKGGEA
jgi:hypothetical protein